MDVATYGTEVPTVVVAGRDAESLVAALEDDADVVAVEQIADALDRLDDRQVDCVVATTLADATAADLLDRVRERSSELPFVYAPDAPEPDVAREITVERATYYLPLDLASADELSSVVADAVDAYDDRRQAERERDMFRELLSTVSFSIYFKDEQGEHVAVSTKADQACKGGAIGKTDLDLFGEVDESGEVIVPESYEDDLAVVESGESIEDQEERVELEGGKVLWLRTTKLPWRNDDGEIVGLVGITRDVTTQKQREQEHQRETRRMEQFASFASHDLRNPVTIAQGYVDRALETDDTEPLEAASEELERMEALIDDLMNVARPDDTRDHEWTDVVPVVERTWAAVDAPDAELTIDVPEDLQIRAASGALRQVLDNVLTNAVEHGGRDVEIEVGLTDTGFYVADDGPGIAEEDRDRVFEYGFTTGGTGIGLAIAAEIAGTHGWKPSATESDAGGARIEFDRCLRRFTEASAPTEGAPIELGSWSTVGDVHVEGGALRSGDATIQTLGDAGDAVDAGGEGDGAGGAADAGAGADGADVAGAAADGVTSAEDDVTVAADDAEQLADDLPAVQAGNWTIRSGGRALWVDIEEYGALSVSVEGDVRIEGRLTGVEQVHEYSKAGLVLADAVEPDQPLGFVGKTAAHGTEAAWRSVPEASVETHQAEPDAVLPRWYRIDRIGDRVTFYASADGEDWRMIDENVLPLDDPIAVGLAVCSHEQGTLCEASFEDVRVVELEADDA